MLCTAVREHKFRTRINDFYISVSWKYEKRFCAV